MLSLILSFHLKKKTFLIFEKFLKTSGTITRVLGCLQIPLMVCKLIALEVLTTSSPESRPRQLFPPFPPPWSLNPLEEALLQPVLRSFISVFILNNEGLENKLTRAPLLGLAKSIYYRVSLISNNDLLSFFRSSSLTPAFLIPIRVLFEKSGQHINSSQRSTYIFA